MSTILETKTFFRLKAAMHDLIDRAGGIDRAAEMCGYSRSTVGRWHCRHADDLMPLAAVMVLELDTGAPLVTRAMCAANGIEASPSPQKDTHVMGAYVVLAASSAGLSSEVAAAVADGVITPGEQARLDQAACTLTSSTEAFRGAIAAAGQAPLKVVS
jgi:hypothetical protein